MAPPLVPVEFDLRGVRDARFRDACRRHKGVVGGMQDPVLLFGQKALTRMPDYVPDLRTVVLDQCGHWIQMEQASEVNREILGFLEEISPRR